MLPALLFVACAPPPWTPDSGSAVVCDSPATTDTTDSAEVEDPFPALAFTWPAQESTTGGCTMFVFDIGDFHLMDFTVAPDNVENEGHIHVYWADQYATCLTPYCLVDFGGIVEGNYSITAELAHNDHSVYLGGDGEVISARRDLHIVPGECLASVEGLL